MTTQYLGHVWLAIWLLSAVLFVHHWHRSLWWALFWYALLIASTVQFGIEIGFS